jgi:hypothetical protein
VFVTMPWRKRVTAIFEFQGSCCTSLITDD